MSKYLFILLASIFTLLGCTNNQKNDLTAFTISIEAKDGITTGISAADRSHTISVAINNDRNNNNRNVKK